MTAVSPGANAGSSSIKTVLFAALGLLGVLFVAAVIFGVRFWCSIRAALALLAAFHGARVEVENSSSRVFINVN